MDRPYTGDGFLDCCADLGIELICGFLECLSTYTHRCWTYTIKALTKVEGYCRTTIAHRLHHGDHCAHDGGNIRPATWQDSAQAGGAELLSAQVNSS